jgi:ABC-type xylose transport system permease subunit
MKELINRFQSPTPGFFKKLIRVGVIIGTIGAGIITAPVSLPALVVTVGGYMAAIGGVAATVSKLAVDDSAKPTETPQ